MTFAPSSAPSPRPSFGLSDWASPNDAEAWAEWQAHVDAGRIGVRLRDPVLEAAADAMEAVVCGRGPAFRRDVASGSSTSGGLAGGSAAAGGGTVGLAGAGR